MPFLDLCPSDGYNGGQGGQLPPPILAAISKPAPPIFWDWGVAKNPPKFGAEGAVFENFGKFFEKFNNEKCIFR